MNFSQKWKASFYYQAQLAFQNHLLLHFGSNFQTTPICWYFVWKAVVPALKWCSQPQLYRAGHAQRLTGRCQSSSYARRWSGTSTSQQDEVGLQRSTEAKLQTQWQSCGLLGKIHWQTGKSCLQGSGKGKPFKAEAWGDADCKKQSWINTDRALNNQAHLYLGRQGKVTRQSLYLN